MKKKKEILEWLQEGKVLTALMAVQLFSVMNLSKVISSLRKDGYNIKVVYAKTIDGQRYGKYYMDFNNN